MDFHSLAGRQLAVYCKNATQARQFVQAAHDTGYSWNDWDRSKTGFDKNPDTCYRISKSGIIMFADRTFYDDHNYKVIPYATFSGGTTAVESQPVTTAQSFRHDPVGVASPVRQSSLKVRTDNDGRLVL